MVILHVVKRARRVVCMGAGYTCEYCGDHHTKPPCDVCDMPPCRCLC